ncbi:MAG: sugar transferase [Bacteroidetes bacterium]|nr:sugar transferase [Bacteroidota bacterium]
MTNLSNLLLNNPIENFQINNLLQQKRLRLLLVLSPAAYEKGEICFSGVDLIIAKDVDEAKGIMNFTGKNYFDALIFDSEIDKKRICEFSAFISHKKITNIPLLLLLLNNSTYSSLFLSRVEGIDDAIFCNTSITILAEKIKTIKKYKYFQEKFPYHVEPPRKRFTEDRHLLKRTLDISLALIFLAIVSPIFILIAIAIKLDSKGPVFYKSLRAGAWYKVFTFYKFRTMMDNADSMIPNLRYMNEYKDFKKSFFFKVKDDPRVTCVGRFLRKTSLDELPQLINVIKGDMSLVGNRPLPLYEAQTITVDKSAKRFFAPAGITGLWQVAGRSNENLTVQERIDMDIDYANKNSFLMDLKILLRTPSELIHKHNV